MCSFPGAKKDFSVWRGTKWHCKKSAFGLYFWYLYFLSSFQVKYGPPNPRCLENLATLRTDSESDDDDCGYDFPRAWWDDENDILIGATPAEPILFLLLSLPGSW